VARLSRGSRNFLIVAVVGLVAVIAGVVLLGSQLNPLGDDGVEPGQAVELTVEQGQSVRAVGDRLADLGVVRSALRFRMAAEDADLASTLRPGIFQLETGMSNDEAIDVLAAGPTGGVERDDLRFTVQEGLTVEQTLARLADQFDDHTEEDFRAVLDERTAAGGNAAGVLQLPDWVPEPAERDDEVLEPYEGLLFPQTYDVRSEATPQDILQRMLNELARAADGVDAEEQNGLAARDLTRYEGLILSSLIERETRVDDERELVSGVLANRLAEPMRLQIDATVLYARGEPTDRVLIADTEIDSPYNTYQVDGLPPTPISGVGNASFRAAYRPAETTALYYVLAPECDGTHRFADTLEEHNRNVQAFRETDGCGVTAD
jgi:UPF0755 protein